MKIDTVPKAFREQLLTFFVTIFGVLVLFPSLVLAQPRYWINGSGNWSDAAHWSTVSGGSGGASVPGAANDAIFDASSGAGTVSIDTAVQVRDLLVQSTASSGLTIAMNSQTLECTRDCLFQGGRIDQGALSTVVVRRNFDTADCDLSTNIGQMSVHLLGTGYWRYRLLPQKPEIYDLRCAQSGHTTSLRPVGQAPFGFDIDVYHKLLIGDSSGALIIDETEVTGGFTFVAIEFQNGNGERDIESEGARIAISALEHDTEGSSVIPLQNNVNFELGIYDVTGSWNAPAGTGPAWHIDGPMDLTGAFLTIEKTASFHTGGHSLVVRELGIGRSSNGTGELYLGASRVTVAENVAIGSRTGYFGRLHLDTGIMTAATLSTGVQGGFMTGLSGSRLNLTATVPSATTTYYVSSQGNDNNSGTSEGSAFATFSRGVQELRAGTRVLFERGSSFPVADGTLLSASGGFIGAFGLATEPATLSLPSSARLSFENNDAVLYDVQIAFGGGSDQVAPNPPSNLRSGTPSN